MEGGGKSFEGRSSVRSQLKLMLLKENLAGGAGEAIRPGGAHS